MPALQVKDCPIELYERLRTCAARENRSISQQTVTILEEYLGMRAPSGAVAPAAQNESRRTERPHLLYSNDERDETDYLSKHVAVFEEIAQLPPLPITEASPRADAILAQIRKEEAR